jgi:hypothetical protein
MSYIGAEPTTASFPFDQFSGNGSTTAFTLTYAPASATSIVVAVSGVVQNPNTYSVSGATLTFTGAPPSGTNNIAVLFLGLPSIVGVPNAGTVGISQLSATGTPSSTTFLRGDNTWNGVASLTTASGSAPSYSARAWVNFNGTGTVAIRASGNVSSITDNGTGDYTVNFTTAMADINYSVVSQVSNTDSGTGLMVTINSNGVGPTYTTAPTTTATRMLSFARATGTNTDAPYVCVSVFR